MPGNACGVVNFGELQIKVNFPRLVYFRSHSQYCVLVKSLSPKHYNKQLIPQRTWHSLEETYVSFTRPE
jgi:hypothetical protein